MNDKIFFATVRNLYKSFLTLLVCVAFLGSQLFIGGVTTSVAQKSPGIDPQFNARITGFNTRANQYNLAASQVRSLAGKSFNTKEDVSSAISALNKQRAILERGPRQSLVDMALKNAAFKKAVEAEAKRVGANALVEQLNANPRRVMDITGASQLESSMKSSLNQISQDFKNLADKLNDAKVRLQPNQKIGGQNINLFDTNNSPLVLTKASYQMFTSKSKEISEKNYYPFRMMQTGYGYSNEAVEAKAAALEPTTIAAALTIAAILIIGAAAAAVVDRNFSPKQLPPGADPETFDDRSPYKVCADNAEEKNDKCLDDNKNNFFGQLGCWAAYTAKMAQCILLPQS